MTFDPTSEHRQMLIQAAQLALIIRDLGVLRTYTGRNLDTALDLFEQRFGTRPELTSNLEKALGQRVGQMIALECCSLPMPEFGPSASKRKAP